MNKFDVQLILGDLKVDGELVFNERDLTIDTFKTTYVIKYININEYYCSDTGFIVKTDSKEYVFNTNEIDSIRKVLDDKLKPEKDIVIDGEKDNNKKESNSIKVSENLLFSDSNKYGTYNFYNNHLEIDYHEGHIKYNNLIIKYNDIEELDFHATSDSEYMFLYIVTNDGETYDFYFNKDKVNECRRVLETRVIVEKEVIEDGAEDDTKSKQSSGVAIALTIATFIFIFGFIFLFYVVFENSNDINYIGTYHAYGDKLDYSIVLMEDNQCIYREGFGHMEKEQTCTYKIEENELIIEYYYDDNSDLTTTHSYKFNEDYDLFESEKSPKLNYEKVSEEINYDEEHIKELGRNNIGLVYGKSYKLLKTNDGKIAYIAFYKDDTCFVISSTLNQSSHDNDGFTYYINYIDDTECSYKIDNNIISVDYLGTYEVHHAWDGSLSSKDVTVGNGYFMKDVQFEYFSDGDYIDLANGKWEITPGWGYSIIRFIKNN